MLLARGTLVVVELDPARGHEQKGRRSAAVVSDPEVSSDERFPMVCVVPVTSTRGTGALYPRLSSGESGLRRDSYALIDQLRTVSKSRVRSVHGRVRPEELEAIDEGLYLFLGLEAPDARATH